MKRTSLNLFLGHGRTSLEEKVEPATEDRKLLFGPVSRNLLAKERTKSDLICIKEKIYTVTRKLRLCTNEKIKFLVLFIFSRNHSALVIEDNANQNECKGAYFTEDHKIEAKYCVA